MNYQVIAITKSSAQVLSLNGLTPIGGTGSAGVKLHDLKHSGEYAILSPQAQGVAIHALRGKRSAPQVISLNAVVQIEDLSVLLLPAASDGKKNPLEKFAAIFDSVFESISNEKRTEKPLDFVLKELVSSCEMEKGLVISKNISGTFEVLVNHQIEKNDAWLSESLVQQTLKSKQPVVLANVIGSQFDQKASLVATGFLSVFCWPLLMQGEIIGLAVIGSNKPHSGLSAIQKKISDGLVQILAVLSHFRLRELHLQKQVAELKMKRQDIPLLTGNPALQETCELARKVASSNLAILVQGETGVGKEVLSRWIHAQSDRKSGPFIAINCSAIPRELLESVLFGHRKGSFTGAMSDQTGKIQQADGGTLFLDEIGDLPLDLQAKLLRVLQDKMVEPLGSSRSVKVDVRILSASHKVIHELVEAKKFREDLFYRLAEMTLWIPPLRERPADIRLLAQHFLNEMAPEKNFSTETLAWMVGQPWRGNTRELLSAIKRAALLSNSPEIEVVHFTRGGEKAALVLSTGPEKNWLGGPSLEHAKQIFIRSKINQALELTAGNRTKAAELLGITPRTLFRYLETDTMTDLS